MRTWLLLFFLCNLSQAYASVDSQSISPLVSSSIEEQKTDGEKVRIDYVEMQRPYHFFHIKKNLNEDLLRCAENDEPDNIQPNNIVMRCWDKMQDLLGRNFCPEEKTRIDKKCKIAIALCKDIQYPLHLCFEQDNKYKIEDLRISYMDSWFHKEKRLTSKNLKAYEKATDDYINALLKLVEGEINAYEIDSIKYKSINRWIRDITPIDITIKQPEIH